MSSNQNFWLDQLEKLGGRFWPPDPPEEVSELEQVMGKYPMMLYKGKQECIVYDDEEFEQAKVNGFDVHWTLKKEKSDAEDLGRRGEGDKEK